MHLEIIAFLVLARLDFCLGLLIKFLLFVLSTRHALCYIPPMQQVQLTFKQLAEAALKLGATPNAIRVWRQRGIPHRYQVKLMQHFNGALKIIDWSLDGDAIATIARPPTLAESISAGRGLEAKSSDPQTVACTKRGYCYF